MDTHLEAFLGHTVAFHAAHDGDDASDHTTANTPCDHCCHGAAHLMGIPMRPVVTPCAAEPVHAHIGPDRLLSVRLSTPTPPPLG